MKFREWLIHKLGGYTKEEMLKIDISSLYPIINRYKTKKLYAQYETQIFERTKEFENNIKVYLCNQLLRDLCDYVKLYDLYKPETLSMVYRVELEVIDKNRGDNK